MDITNELPPEFNVSTSNLIKMSDEDFKKFVANLKTSIEGEESTVNGVTHEKGIYDTLISNSESTVNSLQNQKLLNNIELAGYINKINILYNESTLLHSQIESTIQNIEYQSTLSYEAESTIYGLQNESIDLRGVLLKSEESFIQKAFYYSTLVDNYETLDFEYEQRLKHWENVSDLYMSTVIASEGLSNAYFTSMQKLENDKLLLSKYNESYADIISSITGTNTELIVNSNAYNSTLEGITVLSSLYETAVLTVEWANKVEQQVQIINDYNSALEAKTQAENEYNLNPNDTSLLTAKDLADAYLHQMKIKKSDIDVIVNKYNEKLGKQINTNYEVKLAEIDANIKIELENISTFKSKMELAYKERDNQSSIMEKAIADAISAINLSTLYAEQYNSTMQGVSYFEKLRDDRNREAESFETRMIQLSPIINSLQIEVDDYNSTLDGLIYISSIYTQNYNDALAKYIDNSTLYDSTNIGIERMESENKQLKDAIAELEINVKYYSSIERIQSVRLEYLNNQRMKDYNEMELGTHKYRATYILDKKQQIRAEYDALILQEIQRVSTLTAENPANAVKYSIDYNKPEILQKEREITKMGDVLGDINTLEENIKVQDTNLYELSQLLKARLDAQNVIEEKQVQLETQSDNTDARFIYDSTLAGITDLQKVIDQKESSKAIGNSNIEQLRSKIFSSYFTLFGPTELTYQENTISSFIIAAMK